MAGPDRDRERIDAGFIDEFLDGIGVGELGVGFVNGDMLLDAAELPEFGFSITRLSSSADGTTAPISGRITSPISL